MTSDAAQEMLELRPSGSSERTLLKSTGRGVSIFCAAALVIVVFAAYKPCWHGDWIWDDGILVLDNPVQKPGGLANVWTPGGYLNYWPVSYSAYWLEAKLFGLEQNPFGFHLVNIGLHALAAILLWRLLVRLRLPGAFLAAAIFALHPVNVETVAWISQLRGILSLVFALVSVLFFLSYEQKSGRWRFGLSLLAFALSALSKGDALTLPIVLLALAWWQRRRIGRQDALRAAPFFLIAAVMAALEISAQHSLDSVLVRTDGIFSRTAIAGCAVWFYLWKFIWPLNLLPVYPRWSIPAAPLAYLPLLALAGLFVLAWRYRLTWGRSVVMAIVCFVVLLLPVLGFANITFMEFSLVADHWQYVAMIVPCAAVGSACALLARRWLHPAVSLVGAVALLAPLAILTAKQCGIYIDSVPFYQTVIAGNPTGWIAESNLGTTFETRGRLDEAIAHYQRSLMFYPNDAKVQNSLGAIFLVQGKYDAAIPHLQRAIQINPRFASANYNLAVVLEKQGEYDAAIAHLRRELEIDPKGHLAKDRLAVAIKNRDKVVKDLSDMRQRLSRSPKDPGVLNAVAWLLATSPYKSLRNGAEAVRLAELASKITGGEDPLSLATLAAAYAEAGRFDDAIVVAQRARELATSLPDNGKMAKGISDWIVQFKNKKPFRDLRQK